MTALTQYERLESLGLWKESEGSQRREVIVSFGAASLVLSDANGTPLTHWSLAAVRTLNSGEIPTVYSPDKRGTELLEIDDPAMIEAILAVRSTIKKVGPHPGRLRWTLALVLILIVTALVFFWLPSVSADYAARVLPKATKTEIGTDILAQTNRLTGTPCSDERSLNALKKLENWLLPTGGHIKIVDLGARFSAHLPDGNILLNRILVEEYSGPEIAAGFVLMEKTLAKENDPMRGLFREIGTRGTLTFLANGTLPSNALAAYARSQLTKPVIRPDDAALLEHFSRAALTSSPFAYELDNSGKATKSLIENDPMKDGYVPQITDADWISLQGICDN